MDKILASLKEAFDSLRVILVDFFPKLFIAIVILFIGWLVAFVARWIIRKALKTAKIDQLAEKIKLEEVARGIGIKSPFSKVISSIVYWIIFLVFLIVAADYLEVASISAGIKTVIAYIPTVITALIVFLVGMVVSTIVKKAVYSITSSIGLSGAQAISNIVYYLMAILVGITAMNQAGIETKLITTYLIMIMGSMLLAFAVAYGVASKDLVGNILSSYYGKDKFKIGQKVKIGDITGEIEKIDNLSVILKNSDKKIIIPSKRFLSEEVQILN